jgi:hypothetical protein
MEGDKVATSDKRIDLSFLMEFSAGNKAMVLKYINIFMSQVPVQLENIREGVKNTDAKKLYTALHTLKPQLQFMGITQVFNETAIAESELRDSTIVSEASLRRISLIENEIASALAELSLIKLQYE